MSYSGFYVSSRVYAIIVCPIHGRDALTIRSGGNEIEKEFIDEYTNEENAFQEYLWLKKKHDKLPMLCPKCAVNGIVNNLELKMPDYMKKMWEERSD